MFIYLTSHLSVYLFYLRPRSSLQFPHTDGQTPPREPGDRLLPSCVQHRQRLQQRHWRVHGTGDRRLHVLSTLLFCTSESLALRFCAGGGECQRQGVYV